MNCDPSYLASISDPAQAANAYLQCLGVSDQVGAVPDPSAPTSPDNPVSNAGTDWAGEAYQYISGGATSMVDAVHSAIKTGSEWAGEAFGNIIGWKLLLFLLLVAFLVWKFS